MGAWWVGDCTTSVACGVRAEATSEFAWSQWTSRRGLLGVDATQPVPARVGGGGRRVRESKTACWGANSMQLSAGAR